MFMNKGNFTSGIVLITLGVLFLLNQLFNINFGDWWPVILIVVGVMMLLNNREKSKESSSETSSEEDTYDQQ